MKVTHLVSALSLLTLLLLPLTVSAQDSPTPSAQPEISPEQAIGGQVPLRVRGLLIREMMAIQESMNRVLDALIRGQDDIVAEQGQSIQESFILKQQMTPDDRQALLSAVPEAFVTRDRAFHALGGKLAEAARQKDRSEQLRLYSELVTACADCHAHHALDRFPGLAE